MTASNTLSSQTRRNWWIDALLITSAVVVSLTGIYFLFLPVGGYMGGRNPWYGVTILFDRSTWDWLHTWGGVAMITIAIVHLSLHWSWVVSMARRLWRELTCHEHCINRHSRLNVLVDTVVVLSFILSAISGIYFLFSPGGQGRGAVYPQVLFSHTTWDMIHTWSAVILISAALIHFAIHWQWVVKVTNKVIRGLSSTSAAQMGERVIGSE